MFRRSLGLLGALLLLSVGSAKADTPIDLTTSNATVVAAGGAVFQQFISVPTGTGNYQPFERLQKNGSEEGFNNDLNPSPLDTDHAWTQSIQMNTLSTFTSLGGAVPAGTYYVFSLDINEPNSGKERLLSLDEFQLYTSANKNISGTLVNLQAGATLRYDMDNFGTDYYVKLDHSLEEGSGHDDATFYIPTSYFGAALPTDYLYLYSQFGLQNAGSGMTSADGFEEWKVARGVPVQPPDIPEPATMVLFGSGLAGFAAKRFRSK